MDRVKLIERTFQLLSLRDEVYTVVRLLLLLDQTRRWVQSASLVESNDDVIHRQVADISLRHHDICDGRLELDLHTPFVLHREEVNEHEGIFIHECAVDASSGWICHNFEAIPTHSSNVQRVTHLSKARTHLINTNPHACEWQTHLKWPDISDATVSGGSTAKVPSHRLRS